MLFTWETHLFKTWKLWTAEEVLGHQDLGNHPREAQTKALSGGVLRGKMDLAKLGGWVGI